MDKYEYKVRADEIKDLIAQGEYIQAAEIADTIDWRRVKSVMMLCTISDLYKINRRYEDARNMLLLAYERRPGGRTICYSLCELSIKMEDFVPAVNYYKEFVQVAPKDPGRYILQYKLYEAQDVSLEERIGVLEELKKKDYREKWAYELAYLYHRVGLGTRCVEECDELILWFGEGKYVIKAMELKMLHQPLSPSQQEKYDHRFEGYGQNYYEPPQQETASQKQPYYETQQEGQQLGQPYCEMQQEGQQPGQPYYEMQQATGAEEQFYYETQQETTPREQFYYETRQDVQPQEQLYYESGQETVPEEQFYYETRQETMPREQFYYETQTEAAPQEQPYYGTWPEAAPQEQPYYGARPEAAPQEQPYYGTRPEAVSREQSYHDVRQGTAPGYEMGGKTQIYETVSQKQILRQEMPADQDFTEAVPEVVPEQPEELDIQVKPMDLGQYNTINLQAEIAAGLREVLEEDQKAAKEEEITRNIVAPMMESETESLDLPEIEEVDENDLEPEAEVMEDSEVFFGETGEIGDIQSEGHFPFERETVREIVPEISSGRKAEQERDTYLHVVQETDIEKKTVEAAIPTGNTAGQPGKENAEADADEQGIGPEGNTLKENPDAGDAMAKAVMEQLKRESRAEEQVLTAQPPKEMAGVLSQESDGQISLVMPDSEQIEKQITGQMNLEDILREWERMKQQNAEKRKEEVRQHVLRHTGEMFTAFEAAVRDGLLEQLEGKNAGKQEAENIADGAEEENFYEETETAAPIEEEPVEEYLEDSEDWDSQFQDTQGEEEGQELIPEEAEQEIIFDENDEDIQESYELTDSAAGMYEETEEYAPEAYEEEDFEEPEPEACEAEAAEEPDRKTAEPEETESGPENDGAEEAEAGEKAIGVKETAEPETGTGDAKAAEPELETDEPEESAVQKSQAPKSVKAAKQKSRTDKAEEAVKEPEENREQSSVEREKGKVRGLTKEEKELYGPYIQSRASREQLVQAIDNISMAAYTGNIIITGEEGMDTVSLAKNMIREVQMTDSNFAGKVAKISGQALNKKDVENTINQLASGALIIQKASGMETDTAKRLHKALQQESFGIIIILEDVKKAMNKFLEQHPKLAACFTARMDVESLSNGTLVAFGRKYAREREYSIDDMGILALHTRIDEMQTSDHVVTVLEVKELVDNAIKHANRKNLRHFFDILFARRYDEEDMIVLSERDFV